MKTKFTNAILDLLTQAKSSRIAFHMWGASTPVAMGDGLKFRVSKSDVVDYVYVRFLKGYEEFEVEFGALVGTEYDVLDRITVNKIDLTKAISRKLFSL